MSMPIDWTYGLLGGLMIGCAAAIYLLVNGRIMGAFSTDEGVDMPFASSAPTPGTVSTFAGLKVHSAVPV